MTFTDFADPAPQVKKGQQGKSSSHVRSVLTRLGWQLLFLVVVLVAWQLAVNAHILTTLAISRPTDIWHELIQLGKSGLLFSNIWTTFQEALIGYVAGSIVGMVAGFVMAFVPRIFAVFNPYVTIMNSIPRLALGPLFILWFGIGRTSKIVLVFSLVVFIVFTNTVAGARAVDSDVITVSRLLGASRRQITTKVLVPSTVPWVVAGMRLSIAYAVAGAVVGEMFASQNGIGNLIVAGSGLFNTAEIFAALLTIALIAALMDFLGRLAERRVLRWRPEVELG